MASGEFSDEDASLRPVKLSAASMRLLHAVPDFPEPGGLRHDQFRSRPIQADPNIATNAATRICPRDNVQDLAAHKNFEPSFASTQRETPNVNSTVCNRRSASAPRVVRLSGSLLREQPRRFKLIPRDEENEHTPHDRSQSLHDGGGEREEANRSNDGTSATPENPCISVRPPPKLHVLAVATEAARGDTASKTKKRRSHFSVNGTTYTRLDCIGRGGSCRVYRVLTEDNTLLALKRVELRGIDELAIRGYKAEIDLLKKLRHVDSVVHLLNWELNNERQTLTLVMEYGDLDFDTILKCEIKTEGAEFDINFTRHYWKQMLEFVEAIHSYDIVHADLKPANFILVQGRLKVIDFGIANVIADGTVNVHREHQVGTPNYMAPEALLDTRSGSEVFGRGEKLIKIGKASDIWSLGCILYQMVYGQAPFANIHNHLQRAMTIINREHVINFPNVDFGGVTVTRALIRTLKSCLNRVQSQRPTARKLLSTSDSFLYPDQPKPDVAHVTVDQLDSLIRDVVKFCENNESLSRGT